MECSHTEALVGSRAARQMLKETQAAIQQLLADV